MKVTPMKNKDGDFNFYQLSIFDGETGRCFFQSGKNLIARYDYVTRELTLGRSWDFSATTKGYLCSWVWDFCPNIARAIDSMPGITFFEKVCDAINRGVVLYDRRLS